MKIFIFKMDNQLQNSVPIHHQSEEYYNIHDQN